MYDADKYQDKTGRSRPSQARGKERVRMILAASLELFRERGIEQVTTNDIVKRAGVPIGSLYRYYPNKDSIVAALAELYVADISRVFDGIAKHPMLKYLSWEEVLLMMVDGWVGYARLNGSFALLYALKSNPRLFGQNRKTWEKFVKNFGKVIRKRCPTVSKKDVLLCFQFCLTSAEMGINNDEYKAIGPQPHYDAISIIAAHMLRVCGSTNQHGDDILS